MPDGEMRRPPQPWEKKLARLTSIVGGAGISSSGDGTGVVPPTPTPGTGGGTEPAPVLPAPGAFIKPSTPSLIGQVQGISVIWDGLNSASELWPYDTSWVEIHMSTAGTAFTPGTATLKGRLTRPGAYSVGGLAAGTAYYFKLRGADPAGNYTDPSDAATGYTGLTTSSDYGTATIGTGAVSFNARGIGGVTNSIGTAAPTSPADGDVWLDSSPGTAIIHKIYNGGSWTTNAWGSASIAAGQITALQIAAGAITAGAIAADAITGKTITGGTVTGARINGGTISGGYISGGTVSAGYISGGTINGALITSTTVSGYATSGDIANFITSGQVNGNVTSISGGVITSGTIAGVVLQSSGNSGRIRIDSGDKINFYYGNTNVAQLNGATIDGNNGLTLTGSLDVDGNLYTSFNIIVGSGQAVLPEGTSNLKLMSGSGVTTGYLECQNVYDQTTAGAANVNVSSTGLVKRSTSSERYKFDIVPLTDDLQDVNPNKVAAPEVEGAVDYSDVLQLTPAQFTTTEIESTELDAEKRPIVNSWDQRYLGFVAEDIAAKFPMAAIYDDAGRPDAYDIRAIVAGLVGVVRDQHTAITALTARIEALEAN